MLSDKKTQELHNFIEKWILDNPIDYLWRKHFNITFGSKLHLETSFIQQQIWYEEFKLIEELKNNKEEELLPEEINVTQRDGSIMNIKLKEIATKKYEKVSPEQVEEDIKNLDLSKYYDLEKIEEELLNKKNG